MLQAKQAVIKGERSEQLIIKRDDINGGNLKLLNLVEIV